MVWGGGGGGGEGEGVYVMCETGEERDIYMNCVWGVCGGG